MDARGVFHAPSFDTTLFYACCFGTNVANNVRATFGVSFIPLGVSLGAVATTKDEVGHIYTAALSYNSLFVSHLGAQLLLHYDDKPEDATALNWALQLGTWEYDPHLLDTTETALGLQGELSAKLELADWGVRLNSHLGLLHLQSFHAFQFDARGSGMLVQETLDAWGYRVSGRSVGLTTLWGATPTGGMFATWVDGWYARRFGDNTLELALRAGYKPVETVPPLRAEAWGAC
ncbi:MAG: hypothetical protein ACRCYY_10880 [Trueperaceae bacterium]